MLIDLKCLIPALIFSVLYGWFIAGPLTLDMADSLFTWLDSVTKKDN